jgi:hypothetical protein
VAALRITLYVLIFGAVAGGGAGFTVALATPSDATVRGATLFVASSALLATAGKTLLDLLVAPEDQLRLDRRKRREQRLEDAAAEISGYFGVKGALLLGQLEDAWSARDWEAVRDRAGYLASMAGRCHEIAEAAPDALEILIAVVWVEAGDVCDGAEQLAAVPPADWETHPVSQHLQIVRDWYSKIESRLIEILTPEPPRRPLSRE